MNNKIFVVAEMACSHDGSVRLAKKIIDGAGKSSSDAIQLQIWSVKEMMTPDRSEYKILKGIEFTFETWQSIINYSKENYPKMKVLVCVYENGTIDQVKKLKKVDGFKINSSDLSNNKLLVDIGKTNKVIHLSVGASKLNEINDAVKILKKHSSSRVVLMYGFQSFPTNSSELNLKLLKLLMSKFNLNIGYQDHCEGTSKLGYWLPAYAIGLGVKVIEKHITHDRNKKGLDHESAINAEDFSSFVSMVRAIEKSSGSGKFEKFKKSEINYRKFQKKTIVAKHPIKKGREILLSDLVFLRARKLSYQPSEIKKIINKIATRNIKQYEVIERKHIK